MYVRFYNLRSVGLFERPIPRVCRPAACRWSNGALPFFRAPYPNSTLYCWWPILGTCCFAFCANGTKVVRNTAEKQLKLNLNLSLFEYDWFFHTKTWSVGIAVLYRTKECRSFNWVEKLVDISLLLVWTCSTSLINFLTNISYCLYTDSILQSLLYPSLLTFLFFGIIISTLCVSGFIMMYESIEVVKRFTLSIIRMRQWDKAKFVASVASDKFITTANNFQVVFYDIFIELNILWYTYALVCFHHLYHNLC